MPLDKRETEAGLLKKGFVQDDSHHHYFIYRTESGRLTNVRTHTSHTRKMKVIPNNLISQMARQCGVTTREFKDLVQCPLDRVDYEKMLKDRNAIPGDET